jgi:hypothetical protein
MAWRMNMSSNIEERKGRVDQFVTFMSMMAGKISV